MIWRKWLCFVLPWLSAGCARTVVDPAEHPAPGPGIVFTYPGDGQRDVPVGARLVLKFTDPITDAALLPCEGLPPVGAFCVVGPEGPVSVNATIAGAARDVLLVESPDLRPSTRYSVYVRPEVLAITSDNLPGAAPLFSFETRAQASLSTTGPVLVSVNDDDPRAFTAVDGAPAPKRPLLSFAALRLLFSEPVDVFAASQSVELVEPGEGGAERKVEGAVIVDGPHLTFDPSQDLQAGHAYLLRIAGTLTDAAGESFEPVALHFEPVAANPDGALYPLVLRVADPGTDEAPSTARSRLTGGIQNSTSVESLVIGRNELSITDGAVQAELAAPDLLDGPMAFTIRRGQRLRMSPMQIRLGGELTSGHQTGPIQVVFLSDAIGYMARSPLRAPELVPDDAKAPVTVDLVFDATLSMEDPVGNPIATQTVMGLHVRGTAVVEGDELSIETVGTMELDLMGLERAPTHLVMQLRTDRHGSPVVPAPLPLELVATYPAPGEDDFPPDGTVLLTFSAPVDPTSLASAGIQLTQVDGAQQSIPFSVTTKGDALAIQPDAPLPRGRAYQLIVRGLRGVDGAPLSTSSISPIAFSVPAYSAANETAPVLTALYPGAPCALEPSALPETRCYGGKTTDTNYAPFELPANRPIYARFNQDLDVASMVLGTRCGEGAIRVLKLDEQGACAGAVPGALHLDARGFTFTPDKPWTPGASYRLVIMRGTDSTCGPGEVCGANGRPFNTAPLVSVSSPPTGAPDRVSIPFTGATQIGEGLLPLRTEPFSDVSGNGFSEPEEHPYDENRLALEVTGTSGAITSASLTGTDCDAARPGRQVCVPVRGDLPVSVGQPITPCPVDEQGAPNPTPRACIPVRVYPQSLEAGSITMNVSALLLPLSSMDSGMQVMRIREPGGEPAVGYIVSDPADPTLQFVLRQFLYVDVPDLHPPLGMRHSLHSADAQVLLRGPVTFLADGRMQVALRSREDIDLHVDIRGALDVTSWGSIDLRIPADSLHLTLRGPSPR